MHGQNGNDELHGGLGGNTLYGGDGNDTYVVGLDYDLIKENYSGTDQINLPTGVVLGDLSFRRVSTTGATTEFDDLLIVIDGGGSIQIEGFYYSSALQVETALFSDTSTLNLTTLSGLDVIMTNASDSFNGAGGGNSSYTVYGFDGNDTISVTGTGAHTIDGGNGNDTLAILHRNLLTLHGQLQLDRLGRSAEF